MAFFMDSEIPSADKIMEVFYILMGLMSVYAGVHNLRDRSNPSRYGTFVFWTLLGVVIAFGRWIPPMIDGLLIVIMVIPAIAQRVKPGKAAEPTDAEVEGNFRRIGQKVFIPALAIGVFAIAGALIPAIGALAGCCIGVFASAIILWAFNRANTPCSWATPSGCCPRWDRCACCRCCWPVWARSSTRPAWAMSSRGSLVG